MSQYDYDRGLHSNQPKSNFQSGSQEWEGAQAAELMRARQAEWDRQRDQKNKSAREDEQNRRAGGANTSAPAATGLGGPGGIVALEGGILSGFGLYRNWPQYISLYSSFPRINLLWEYGAAAGLVLLSAILYMRFCRISIPFTWGSFITVGAILAAWSRPWGLNWKTCLVGVLVFIMFLDRR